MTDVDDDYDNLRVLLNLYGPFDMSRRAEIFADYHWPHGWPRKVWWMFIKSIFIRNQ